MPIIKLANRLRFINRDGHKFSIDFIRKIPQIRYFQPLLEHRVGVRLLRKNYIEYGFASCRALCGSYDVPVTFGCNLPHLINAAPPQTTLAELHARSVDHAAFKPVSLLMPDEWECRHGAWIFSDFSARLFFARGGRQPRVILVRSILELEYKNNLRRRLPGHPARIVHDLIAEKYSLEMVAFLAAQSS